MVGRMKLNFVNTLSKTIKGVKFGFNLIRLKGRFNGFLLPQLRSILVGNFFCPSSTFPFESFLKNHVCFENVVIF